MKLFRIAKKTGSFHLYQMSSDDDYFYIHPYSLILGILGACGAMLPFLIFTVRVSHKIW